MQDTSVSVLRPFHQAYYSANCQAMVGILGEYGMPLQLADIIEQLHQTAGVMLGHQEMK